MFSKPKMILFDYGGTLLREPDWDMLRGERAVFAHVAENPRGCTPEALAAWERDQLFSPRKKALRDLDVETTMVQLLRLKYELHGIRLDVPYEEAEFILWSGAAPMSERCVTPHIRETLELLHERGIRTGVISNLGWSGASLTRRINTLLPDNRFELILTSSDYGIRKPDTRLFLTALARAGLGPEEAWYCGNDYRKDVDAARRAGLFAVWYRGEAEDGNAEPPAGPADLTGAAAITDWRELPALLEQAEE